MFAGLAAFVLDDEKTTITGMASGEAEIVPFRKSISIKVRIVVVFRSKLC